MKFKQPHLKEEFDTRPEMLKQMAYFFERCSMEWGIEPVVTRVLERISGSSGVHEAGRAIDLRSTIYTQEQIVKLLDLVNRMFVRKDGKRVLIYHSFNGGAYHFHLQSSARPDVIEITGTIEA